MQQPGDPQRPPPGSPPPFHNPQGSNTPPLPPHHQGPAFGAPGNPQFKPPGQGGFPPGPGGLPTPGPYPSGPPPGGFPPGPPGGFPPGGFPPGPPGGFPPGPPGQFRPGPPGPPPGSQPPPGPPGQFPGPPRPGNFPPGQGPPPGPPGGPIHGPPGQFPPPMGSPQNRPPGPPGPQRPPGPPGPGTQGPPPPGPLGPGPNIPPGPPRGSFPPGPGLEGPPPSVPLGPGPNTPPPPFFNPNTPPQARGAPPPTGTPPPISGSAPPYNPLPPHPSNLPPTSQGTNTPPPPQFHNPNNLPPAPQFHNPNSFTQRAQPPTFGQPPQPGTQPPVPTYGAQPPQPTSYGAPPAPYGTQPPPPSQYGSQPPPPVPGQQLPPQPRPPQQPTSAPAQPPASRIDPAQIPSPTTVADGRTVKYLSGSGPCQPPPPASVQYVSIDEGNATPRFVRMSVYNLPCTDELQSTSHIPLSMIVQPLAEVMPGEDPVPLVDLSAAGGPIRCRRCHAYMNPFNIFVDGGRKYLCKLCSCENDVPEAYFSPLEVSGKRHDLSSRPELSRGSVDVVAPPEYIQRPPSCPSFVFVIDVSEWAVSSGLMDSIINTLRVALAELAEQNAESDGAVDPRIGIITYDATIHFWNIRPNLSQPQMLVVSDLTNVFVPLSADALLVPYSQARTVVDILLDTLPTLFRSGRAQYSALASAVQASSFALEQAGGGRAVVFWSGVEPGTAPAKRREELKAVGTDKEKTLLTVRNPIWKDLAKECIGRFTSVDLFLCTSAHGVAQDVASLAALPAQTGAGLFYFPAFDAERDGERLGGEVRRVVTRPSGYDAIAKVRTSAGLTVVDYIGNVRLSSNQDLEFSTIDCDKSIQVNLKHDDKLDEKTDSIIQFAMLYTSSKGDRRIRVHTISLSNTNTIGNLYKNADLDTILNVYARQVVRDMQANTLASVRSALIDKCVEVLAAYRKHCASTTSPGQLILPESLKLLPIYVLALTKHQLFKGYVDVQAAYMHAFLELPPSLTTPLVYPRLYPLHKPQASESGQDDTGRTILPTPQRLISEYLEADGAYLAENGSDMYLWLGRNTSPATGEMFAEVAAAANLRAGAPAAPRTHPETERTLRYVHAIRRQRCKGAVVRIARSRDPLEGKLIAWLVEDRAGESPSYVDFLVQVHKMIQGRLA